MLAIGCLIPFVMLVIGAVLGSYLGDVRGGYWGAGAGAGLGCLVVFAGIAILGRTGG
jgi:hypothetical protein